MRICCLYTRAIRGAPWDHTEGIVSTLRKMGHLVLAVPVQVVPGPPTDWPWNVDVDACDLILYTSLEWYWSRLPDWMNATKIPKAAWYVESWSREDTSWDFRFMKPLAQHHFHPAKQEAEKHGMHWLPFGVDTDVFKPYDVPKTIDVGFIGTVYDKRRRFLEQVKTPITILNVGNDNTSEAEAIALAKAYCSCKIVVNLPNLSRLVVHRVYDAWACQVPILSEWIEPPQFEYPGQTFYRDASDFDEKAQFMLAHCERQQATMSLGSAYIRETCSLRARLSKLLEVVCSAG